MCMCFYSCVCCLFWLPAHCGHVRIRVFMCNTTGAPPCFACAIVRMSCGRSTLAVTNRTQKGTEHRNSTLDGLAIQHVHICMHMRRSLLHIYVHVYMYSFYSAIAVYICSSTVSPRSNSKGVCIYVSRIHMHTHSLTAVRTCRVHVRTRCLLFCNHARGGAGPPISP